ncbi:hypothetical protein NL108_003020 [Boleophthalmus pectinirostris]|nr:hypothetical protein NL108_003020 [Boleophthalmus pectinirostris]
MMNEFTERELALYQKREALQAVLLEKKSNVDKCLKAMMLKQELAIMEVKYKYDHIHKEKQRFHLEKFQEIMSGHAKLMDKEMSRVLEDIAAKCRLRSQDVQRQWQCLSDKAVSQVKMKKDVQPNAVEELILSDTSDSSDEEETM